MRPEDENSPLYQATKRRAERRGVAVDALRALEKAEILNYMYDPECLNPSQFDDLDFLEIAAHILKCPGCAAFVDVAFGNLRFAVAYFDTHGAGRLVGEPNVFETRADAQARADEIERVHTKPHKVDYRVIPFPAHKKLETLRDNRVAF